MSVERVPFRHGPLTVAVPADWRDETTVVLSSPPRAGLAAPLSARAATEVRDTLTLTLEARPEDISSARDYLERMGEQLAESGVAVKTHHLFPVTMCGTEGACAERSVDIDGLVVRQLTGVALLGDHVVVATASTAESDGDRSRHALLELVTSVQVG